MSVDICPFIAPRAASRIWRRGSFIILFSGSKSVLKKSSFFDHYSVFIYTENLIFFFFSCCFTFAI